MTKKMQSSDKTRATLQQPPEGGWHRRAVGQLVIFGFNTQPPEGGWAFTVMNTRLSAGFNTQPPEGGWDF